MPLLKGGADYATSWGTLAIVRPETISVSMSIVFTALAYLYMCLCFYLFFAGLILLYTMVHDLWRIAEESKTRQELEYLHELNELGMRLMRGIFRCTILGISVAICMKAQSAYLASDQENIVRWFVGDLSSTFFHNPEISNRFGYRMPTHYSSLLVAISACVVFLYGSIRFGRTSPFQLPLWKMSAVVALLFVSYLLIGSFVGFSILLGIGALLGIYGLYDPEFGRSRELGNQSVL